MTYTPTMTTLLKQINEGSKKEVVEKLRNSPSYVKEIVRYALSPDIKFLLPEGRVNYTTVDEDYLSLTNALYHKVRKLYVYTDDPQVVAMPQEKRERFFGQFLKELHPEDAELVLQVKDKKLPFENITLKAAKEAWPDFCS